MDDKKSNCSMINQTTLHKTKVVHLQRRRGVKTLGFSIRGGKEHKIGIFISEIDPGSEADVQGLKVGDEILKVNGCSLQNFTHREVLQLFHRYNDLTLLIKRIGLVPVKDHKDDEVTWKFVEQASDLKKTSLESSPSIGEGIEMKIFIDMTGHAGLGCSICKGPKEKKGLFVQTVKDGGLAQQYGLQVGDQIVQVNSIDLSTYEFQQAVTYLKSQQKLEFLIRKGAARDLFPVESSGYNSSSSSINGDTINEDLTKVKLPSVQEELSQDRHSPDKILNITTEETEEIIQNETVTEEEEVHETMQSDENETETIREERKFSETVTQIKRVVTTVDVHQNQNELLEGESDDDIIDSIRKVAEDNERRDAEETERRDAETQTPTSEMSEDENSAKLLSIKLGNIWKEAAANGHFQPQPPPMPQDDPIGLINGERFATKKSTNRNKSGTIFPPKNAEDLQKKQQHDLLIEEFKRVHKLMTDTEENSNILPPPQGWESDNEVKVNSRFPKTRQVITKTTKNVTEETETEEYTEVNTVIEPSTNANEVLYIDVGPNLPTGNHGSQKSPQRSPIPPSNITDSKYEVPKPPEFFFPREKPLVTIGTYQDSKQPNKFGFLQNPAVKIVTSKKIENGHSSNNQINNPIVQSTNNGQWIRENRFKPGISNGKIQQLQNALENERFSPKFGSKVLENERFSPKFGPKQLENERFSTKFGPKQLENDRFSPKFGPKQLENERFSPKFGPRIVANGDKVKELSNKIFQNGRNDNFKLTDWKSNENEHQLKTRNDIVIHNGPKKSMAFIQTNGIKDGDRNGIVDLERNKVKIQVKSDIPAPELRTSTKVFNKRSIIKTHPISKASYDDYPIIIEDLPKAKDILVEDFNPLKLFTQSQIARREVKMYSLPKANAMDIKIDGGYGSQLGGRIIVASVREGGEIYKHGVINRGDQIMWINGCSMIDITLSQAHGIMREAAKHSLEPLKIIIAKAPNGLFDDVSYF